VPHVVRVGLTGGIAAGKSLVAREFAERGAVIIDADVLAREVVEPGTSGLAAVVARFGASILTDGRLDRKALGRIVFADEAARRDLEAIVHPAVRRRAAELEAEAAADAVVVHVIPLLVETAQQDSFDVVVVVDADPETQIRRLREREGISAEEASARLAAQAARDQRLVAADVIIDNNGDVTELRRQIDQIWPNLTTQANPR
jgi:dephospho-CoA kinase